MAIHRDGEEGDSRYVKIDGGANREVGRDLELDLDTCIKIII